MIRYLKNERGDSVVPFTGFFVMAMVILLALLMMWISAEITFIGIRNSVKNELTNVSMLEQEDDITPEERAWLMTQSDIIDKISTSFDNYDSFWDCYWEVFRDIAEEKLKEYRKEGEDNRDGTDNIQ